jgi:hypothetical protein
MSSVGTPPGSVLAGNFTSSTNTCAARPVDGMTSDVAARIASARCTPTADVALPGNNALGQEPASIGPNRPLFSQAAPHSAESLNTLQGQLELLWQKLSRILDSASPTAPAQATSAPQSAQPASVPVAPAAQQAGASTATAAESPYPDLGPHPFMSNPTGTGPTGSFGFNPEYFPTEQTATKIADMLGGKVVPQTAILNATGSPFKQNQVNYMVELPNGRTINPGVIAQAISVGQPRTMIDAIIASEVTGDDVQPGQAPPFVPVNRPIQSTAVPAAPASNSTATAGSMPKIASQTWSHMDPMQRDTGSLLLNTSSQSNPAILTLRDRLDQTREMLQVVSQLISVRSSASDSQGLQTASHNTLRQGTFNEG